MAQCNSFGKFSSEAGSRRFGSARGMPSGSRIYGGLSARSNSGASPILTVHKMERSCSRHIFRNNCVSLQEFTSSKKMRSSVGFISATHGREHIVSLAEDRRASSLTLEEMDIIRQRGRLKEKLCSALKSTRGSLDDEGTALISSLRQLNPNPDITRCGRDLYIGLFKGVKASFKGTGKKGEAQKEVGASGTVVTLGRASFNSFKPQGLEIRLNQTYNHVGQGSDDAYVIILVFSVHDNCTLLPPLEGLLINKAKFSISNPGRMDVVFLSSTLAPRFPERDLDRWFKLFKTENSNMDEEGSVTLSLPPAKGWLDYLYLDEEIRITKGNRGGIFVVRRMDEPVVSV
ncbi:hypothetical protein O6H91_05G020200 [Diphasiastrum complanatum]|uniref:Uncharacterized protein n=1 Tax=Diphasiastrum complanatum TaxID=34168 RepID=A0ACC2DLS2_DIPCM|nr:hypothetical protein O6H91_05G020200 [Diphasiastrum complanatum]